MAHRAALGCILAGFPFIFFKLVHGYFCFLRFLVSLCCLASINGQQQRHTLCHCPPGEGGRSQGGRPRREEEGGLLCSSWLPSEEAGGEGGDKPTARQLTYLASFYNILVFITMEGVEYRKKVRRPIVKTNWLGTADDRLSSTGSCRHFRLS